MFRACNNICCVHMSPCWLGRGAPTRTIRPPNAMRRERGEPERLCGEYVASVQQHMFRVHVTLLTRSRRADADYSKPNAKRRERGEPKRTMRPLNAKRIGHLQMLRCTCCGRATTRTVCLFRLVDLLATPRRGLCDLRSRYEESAASRRGLFDLRARCEESAAHRHGPKKLSNPVSLADAFT
jgi:hypothetical protein